MQLEKGNWVMQKSKEKASLFPRLYPPAGTLGVISRWNGTGYQVQWYGWRGVAAYYAYPEQDLIYAGVPNQYGYRYKLTNQTVAEYYARYLAKHQLHRSFPVSDQQRAEFERGLDKLLLLGRHTPEELFT